MMNTAVGTSQNPVLTIIIATFNAAAFIKDCLNSITENVHIAYELIIIDGKSQDNTLEIINTFQNINPILISEPDKGIYDAMNKGINLAKGKWIVFLGADDRILPTFKDILNHLNDERTIYYGNCRNGQNHFGGKFSNYKIAKMNLCHQAILYPSSVFRKYKFDVRYPVFADYLLNIQCWGDKNFNKKYIDVDTAYYNLDGFSSTAKDPDFKRNKSKFVQQYLGNIIYLRYMIRKFKESKKPDSEFF